VGNKIRVLVVDDSFLMRKLLSDIIAGDPDLVVIDKAKNGQEALEKILRLKPDVVTMDINMPLMDGLAVLKEVMMKQPTRIIMISAYTRSGASATFDALKLGAVDFIPKPSGEISLDLRRLKDEIIAKIKIAAAVDINKAVSSLTIAPFKEIRKISEPKVVVIGASTGGPRVLLEIMQHLPHAISAPVLIVQHMPEGFTLTFAERLAWESEIRTKEAENDDILEAGKAFVAPAGYHMVLEKSGNQVCIRLNQDPFINFVRPSIDPTLMSAAEIFGTGVIAVILTGMGKDGLDGSRRVKEKGGVVIVQNQETSAVWGMPRAVSEAGLANEVVPAVGVADTILRYL